MRSYLWSTLVTLFLVTFAEAFYLPGVAPTTYAEGDRIELLVNHLTPSLTHLTTTNHREKTRTQIYSYDYYYPKFQFCKPAGGPKKQLESLGAIIFGDRIFNSPFDILMLKNEHCKTLCPTKYSKTDAAFVSRNIRAGYNYNWIIDGLPAAKIVKDMRTSTDFYSSGFPIGEVDDSNRAYLFNHFNINVEYHKRAEGQYRVVGITVASSSMDRSKLDKSKTAAEDLCNPKLARVMLSKDTEKEVLFTYSVTFLESSTAWATRWDKYLHIYDPKIQWVSLINFSLVVIILGVIMAHILVTTLKNDIVKYNEVNLDDDVAYDSGWKLVYGDVFRSPPNRMLLSVLVGSGAQLFCMTLVTIFFAVFGLLSPSNRGSLSTFMFILFIFFSIVSSYVSGYLYRFFGGENWKVNMLMTPTLVPGVLFGVIVFLNFFLINAGSSGAIPAGTMLAMVLIWFAISFPLSVVGSILQSKKPILLVPVRTNQIPRQVPQQPWYLKTVPGMIMSGLFPFGSIAVEFYFIFSSIWFNRIFYMFGFLFFCFILMILTTGLITLLFVYYTLCSENYKWQWKALLIGGGCSVYVFLHSLILVKGALKDFTSMVLYLGYTAVISILVFLVCGSVGFICALFFVRRIYSQIKID